MSIGTIDELKKKKCVPCEGGVPPVTHEEAERLLKDLRGWNLTGDGIRIRREFEIDLHLDLISHNHAPPAMEYQSIAGGA